MNKLVLLGFGIVVVALGVATSWDRTAQSYPDLVGIIKRDLQIQHRAANYQYFKTTLDGTVASLSRGEMSLSIASEQLHEAAVRYFPEYLGYLKIHRLDASDRERLAENLVRHIRTEAEFAPELGPRVRELERELSEYCKILREGSSFDLEN